MLAIKLFFLIFSICSIANAEVPFDKIFQCQTQHSLFDANFEQGSQIYLDIYYSQETHQAYLNLKPSEGPEVVLYSPEESQSVNFDIENSTGLLTWKSTHWESYASMVYIGGPWGFVTKIPEEMEGIELHEKELEMMCKETPFFEQHFIN